MDELKQSPVAVKSTQTKREDIVGRCEVCLHRYGDNEFMHCRRYPPIIVTDSASGEADVKFPGIVADWNCGEFEENV